MSETNRTIKIAVGIITYNSDFILKECIASIYKFASQILISEGCVSYFTEKGFTSSTDDTNKIIHEFPDPDNKIKIWHGTYKEKTEQANVYMPVDADYIWNIDSDEIFKPEDIKGISTLLETEQPTSVGFKSKTFYGGFDRVIGGFEARAEYRRIFKINKESKWANHRPPQIDNIEDTKHISGDTLAGMGIYMYHYSYVWNRQVRDKVEYYKAKISKDNCIDNYYEEVFGKWVNGSEQERKEIEYKYNGVHEFKPSYRGDAFTKKFTGQHPEIISEAWKVKYFSSLDRTESINRLVPELFKSKTALYVGARVNRMDYVNDFNNVTILEIFEDNCKVLRQKGFKVIQGDIRIYKPRQRYDCVFYWHGIEHIQEDEIPATLKLIESYTDLVVLGCPWGCFKQNELYGNPFERHITAIKPHMLKGYDMECLGIENIRGSNTTAVKRQK